MLFGCTVVSLLDSKIPVYRRMALYIPDLPTPPTDRDAPPAGIHCGHYAGAGETDRRHTLLLSPRYLVAAGLATVRVCLRRGRGHPPPHPPRACIVPSYTHNFILQRGSEWAITGVCGRTVVMMLSCYSWMKGVMCLFARCSVGFDLVVCLY